MRGLRNSVRGSVEAYVGIGIVALIAFLIFAIFFPALLLAMVFGLSAIFVWVYFKAHPYSIWIGLGLLLLAAVFGFVSVGQQASLSLVHGM